MPSSAEQHLVKHWRKIRFIAPIYACNLCMSVFDLTPLANFNPRRIVVACNNALDVVIAFIKAWTGHDIDTAADYVADDVVFDGSMQQSTGKDQRATK